MRKQFYLFLFFVAGFFSTQAAPGDTTWVQAQNDIQLNYYNNFDAAVNFPMGTTSYRKVIMIFTLGKYQCDTSAQYCGDWDYTVQNFLMTGTDTFELGRLITPYANASYPRTPWTWKQRYYFDVTDYYPVLKNNATVRINYQGYSGGFTANIKFAFIEGTPPRNVTGIKRLWHGSFSYGNAADPIENHLPAISNTAPAGTQSADMKFTVTGHGSDASGCSEFCTKYYQVYSNSTLLAQKSIWRDNCGYNNLYPQSGTWMYNRGNWCPGDSITPAVYKLGNVTAGSNISADVNFQTYTGNGSASYIVDGAVFFYGPYNQTVDASVEDIISPTNYEGNFRANPMCGKPVIKIKNTGATTLTSVSFQYGKVGQSLQTYTATGLSLASSASMEITLPDLAPLNVMQASSNAHFTVSITQVNGVADPYSINNTMTSTFKTAADWPASFVVSIRTNNDFDETSWKLEGLAGNIIAQFPDPNDPTTSTPAAFTLYNKQISQLPNGCYKLTVTDTYCDGLLWWGNPNNLGAFFVRTADQSAFIPFTNGLPPAFYNTSGGISIPTASQDFGCGFTQYFRVGANTPLPVALLSFTGYGDEKNTNHLVWKTSTEVNTSHFEVEFSTDGNYFEKIADEQAAGNTTSEKAYSLLHTPVRKANLYYYRLKMVDKDGQYKYSNTVTIKPQFNNYTLVSVMPNPFTTKVNVTLTAAKAAAADVQLLDIQGRAQHKQTFQLQEGVNNLALTNMDKLSDGVYMLQVQIGSQKFVEKIVHQAGW